MSNEIEKTVDLKIKHWNLPPSKRPYMIALAEWKEKPYDANEDVVALADSLEALLPKEDRTMASRMVIEVVINVENERKIGEENE